MRISLRELMLVVAVAAIGLAGLKFASSGMLPLVQAMTGIVLFAFLVRAFVDRGSGQSFAIGFVLCGFAYLFHVAFSEQSIRITTNLSGPQSLSGQSQVDIETPAGTFGTGRVLSWLYGIVKSEAWINTTTQVTDYSFQPQEFEANNEYAYRIEIASPPPKTNADEKNEAAADESSVTPGSARRGQPGNRGRGRRGGRPSSGNFSHQLTAEQQKEFDEYGSNRQQEIASIFRDPEGQAAIVSGQPLSTMKQITYRRREAPTLSSFRTAGFCLWALIIGYAGGLLARYVYGRRAEHKIA